MSPPVNLKLSPFLLIPAVLPGSCRFWAVYERLDAAEVLHARYIGLLPGREGEDAEALQERAAALAAGGS